MRLRSGLQHTIVLAFVAALVACAAPSEHSSERVAVDQAPERFTIVPDDYHVPYAGSAEDGRKFFLSDELLDPGGSAYVGLFLWNADGTFVEVRVDTVSRPEGLPPGQASPAGADELVAARLAELGDYVLEPIEVEPFTKNVGGVTFGWRVSHFDGTYSINIEPGDFIAYYEPWDGLEYDSDVRTCRCRRAYVIEVFASDTRVPTTKAAATAGMNHPGRTRARHSDQMATNASRMPNTMLPTWPRSVSGRASSHTGGQ